MYCNIFWTDEVLYLLLLNNFLKMIDSRKHTNVLNSRSRAPSTNSTSSSRSTRKLSEVVQASDQSMLCQRISCLHLHGSEKQVT